MKSFKSFIYSLNDDPNLHRLSDIEITKLRKVFLDAYQDLSSCCKKNNLTLMLIGGTALGAVRHHGFIPWDDDMDVAIPREDFEQLKTVFEKELGNKYILSAPNYKNNAKSRFPKMLVRDTIFAEGASDPNGDLAKIKIDIFVIENVPNNKILRYGKGLLCNTLMYMASCEGTYEGNSHIMKEFMCRTEEGKKVYRSRMRRGRLFSFFNHQTWMNIVDHACQYHKKTRLMGIPTGRGHYLGEIRPRETFLPISKGIFEGLNVTLPGNVDDYLSNLYGKDYMTLPPEDKRERHPIRKIKFNE